MIHFQVKKINELEEQRGKLSLLFKYFLKVELAFTKHARKDNLKTFLPRNAG